MVLSSTEIKHLRTDCQHYHQHQHQLYKHNLCSLIIDFDALGLIAEDKD